MRASEGKAPGVNGSSCGLFVIGLMLTAAWLSSPLLSSTPPSPPPVSSDVILYVDDDAPSRPQGDGLSWETAFSNLQDALAFAADPANQVSEIRIAQGVYKPDQGANVSPGDVNASFMLINAIALRGSFAGAFAGDGVNPDAQDFENFQTILSGDLLGNDGFFTNYQDNSKCIVQAIKLDQLTVLEGLVIRGGNWGAPQILDPPYPPDPYGFGGGLFSLQSQLEIRDCQFLRNRAAFGGGFAARLCLDTTVRRCLFQHNSASSVGGGAHIEGGTIDAEILVADSFFQNQNPFAAGVSAIASCGALFAYELPGGVPSVVENCDFVDNYALYSVGGPCAHQIRSSRIISNSSDAFGGGFGNFYDSEIAVNFSYFGVGGAAAQEAVNCTFAYNSTGLDGGGGLLAMGNPANIVNCTLVGNSIWDYTTHGTAARINSSSHANIVNCLIEGSVGFEGAASTLHVSSFQASTMLINCTMTDNTSLPGGSGVAGTGSIVNSILWNTGDFPIAGKWNVHHSLVEGGWMGEGNVDGPPVFVDTGEGDFRLQSGSPCIDAGDNDSLPPDEFDLDDDGDTAELLPVDLDGNPRQSPGTPVLPPYPVDMGCYEFQVEPLTGDVNLDGAVNVDDLLAVISNWGVCTPPPAQCSADIAPPGPPQGDGLVNWHDLLLVLLNWT